MMVTLSAVLFFFVILPFITQSVEKMLWLLQVVLFTTLESVCVSHGTNKQLIILFTG